jgi:hypothetical protein
VSIGETTSCALPPAGECRLGVAAELGLAGMSSWCVVDVVGSMYGPVNPLFLLAGHGIVVSSNRVVGCGNSSSDPLFLCQILG